MLIAGNGLSISMLEKNHASVDLSNLFSMGCDVTWPATGKPGFLSYEHCPNLWALGARQTTSPSNSYEVIEQKKCKDMVNINWELENMEKEWLEKLEPHDDKGYNKKLMQ